MERCTRGQLCRAHDGVRMSTPEDRSALVDKLLREHDQAATELAKLSPQETLILCYTAKGLDVKEVARLLDLSQHTVADHRKRILKKLGVSRACEAAVLAAKAGIV